MVRAKPEVMRAMEGKMQDEKVARLLAEITERARVRRALDIEYLKRLVALEHR